MADLWKNAVNGPHVITKEEQREWVQGLVMLFDLEEAIMFTPQPQEFTDPMTGEVKKKQVKFFPDIYKGRIGRSWLRQTIFLR